MGNPASHEPALEPESLAEFFVSRANAGDVEGLVALYEPKAVLACGDGRVATGIEASTVSTTRLPTWKDGS